MAEICSGVVSDSEAASKPCEGSSRAARRRRMEIRRFKLVTEVAPEKDEVVNDNGSNSNNNVDNDNSNSNSNKRRKIKVATASLPGGGGGEDGEECWGIKDDDQEERIVVKVENGKSETKEILIPSKALNLILAPPPAADVIDADLYPKYGVASVCGRRRDMEDAVATYPFFFQKDEEFDTQLHYFGVYDGHGCSHVAARCRERLHELVREEVAAGTEEWKSVMERSFCKMDEEVIEWTEGVVGVANCRCEMQTPECDAVGSTAVVAIVTPDKIIVANCGDSRAVLSRNGKPVPLSNDHKPDRPDELNRIQAAGGRVIYWDGPRVLGVLAMSRAIGDNYLKPYVSCEPEVTITERTPEDDCLILASDGLWDVVSNDTACGVARMCLRGKRLVQQQQCFSPENDGLAMGRSGGAATSGCGEMSDKACSDASMLLTKLALARRSTDNVSVVVVDLRKDT
ncbi:probable protein phosphatase 2C 24 [Ricinus communis]|uniref:probable protein phosphatase 2C 24 n=1 Tax=Ricinus communis TaxID=3988 RepID=UPI00201AEC9B|nr:probable protein phosphatase 2C 24 [Ricinus communis]